MADTKISALPSGAPAQATDEFIVARSGSNYKLTYANLEAVMDAATAAKLTSATTINGVSFDGSAPITVTAATPNTLTLGTGLGGTSFNGSANVTATVTYGTTAGTACQGNDARLSDTRTTTGTLTLGTGLSGTSFNGSGNVTAAVVYGTTSGTACQGNDSRLSDTRTTTGTLTLGTGLTGTSFNGSGNVTAAVSYGTTSGTACQGNDSRLSDSRQATNTNTQLASLGVGTAASGTSGEIRATNNVTAYYSDARLKNFKGTIGDALHKVHSLNGYYYVENAKAKEFGFDNDELQVGVSAQEVQAIMPEVVAPAPFDMDENNQSKSGEHYMTVRYEKLVPLLIEAIKELSAKVEALEGKK